MRKKIKFFCYLVIIVFLSITVAGCYDRRELDDMAYAVAVGIEKGKNNVLKLSLQFIAPLTLGGGSEGSGGGGGGEKSIDVITVETPTIYAGLNMVNISLSKQVNLSHANVIVFSEELAKEGIHKYIHALVRGREFRPNANIVVSRESPEEFLKQIKPVLDPHLAKYYELLFRGANFTGFFTRNQIHDVYMDLEALNRSAVATLAGLDQFESSQEFDNKNSTYQKKGRSYPLEGDYKAGDVPKTGDVKAQVIGLAAFKGDKMVGELDGEEASFYSMITGEFVYSYWSIPDPKSQDDIVVISLKKSRNPVKKVELNDDKPKISVKLNLEADFLSIQSGENYEKDPSEFEKKLRK